MIAARFFRVCYRVLVDYCTNCSLAGLAYVADRKYHCTERLFWLACLLLSWTGSYYLITTYMESFRKDAISMVVESTDPATDTERFPSVAVCEMGYVKQYYESLENLINDMKLDEDTEYNYDVEDFMLRVIFQNLYNYGSITSYCTPYKDCDDCIKCPLDGYQVYALAVRANCTQLFDECSWNGVKFDCCRYFRPLQTSMGSCFILNSLQIVQKHGKYWLHMEMDSESPTGVLQLNFSKATSAYVLNEEDIPHMLLTTLQFTQMPEGYAGEVYLTVQSVINDPQVRKVGSEVRRCIFPDEVTGTSYKKYSYSACVTDCLKHAQIKSCNCCHHNMILNEHDKSPVCNFAGLTCLDQRDLMFPQTTIMQPWRTNGLVCQCLPSCTEHEIKIIGKQSDTENRNGRSLLIKVMGPRSQRYRRQVVRDNLDVVVSIGGILGLFIGASILSLGELLYFFTVRFVQHMINYVPEPLTDDSSEESASDTDDSGHSGTDTDAKGNRRW